MKNPYDYQFQSLLQKYDSTQFKKDFFNDLLSSGRSSLNKKVKTFSLNNDTKNKVFKSLYPNSLGKLGMDSFIYKNNIDDNSAIYYSKCLLEFFSDKINFYITSKKSYELQLQRRNYTDAKKILDDIDSEVGVSLWSCGQRLLIEQKENSIREKPEYFLDKYFENEHRNLITIFNLFHLSFLADNELKYNTYKKLFQKYIDDIKNETVKKYILSKFSFNRTYLIDNISLVLQVDSQYSIIDMYNDLETIIPVYYKKFFTSGIGTVLQISKVGIKSKLANNIDLIQCIYNNTQIPTDQKNLNCQIIEQYIIGEYQIVFDLVKEALEYYVIDFDIAYMFCTSAIRLGVTDLGNAPSYIVCIWNLLKMDNQLRDSIIQLQKELRQSWGLSHNYALIDFSQKNKLIDTEWGEYDFVSQTSFSNINAKYIKKISNSLTNQFFDYFVRFAPNAVSYYNAQFGNYALVTNNSINYLRKEFLNIDILIANDSCHEAIISLKKLAQSGAIANAYDKTVFYKKYIEAYLKLKDFYSVIKIVVDIYFDDNKMFLWINNIFASRIPQKIRDNGLQSDIVNIIYEYIINPTNYSRQIIAYSNYLDNNNYDTIFEALEQFDVNSEKEKFFFDTVCSIDLLKRDPMVKKAKKTAEDARIIILQKMYDIYKDSKYTKEIESIRTAVYIKNNLSKINKSRIYVDTEKIYSEHKDEWSWMCNKLHESLQGKSDAIACINDEATNFDTLNAKVECPSIDSQPLNILNRLLNSMLKEFLFSQPYGLETYLSSRIRHGYCREQLTNFLNEQHLLSLDKSQSGELLINTYWSEKLKDDCKLHEYVMEALSTFTRNINGKVDEILKKWLRIQWYGIPDGLFKFAELSARLPVACDYYLKASLTNSASLYREFTKLFWDYTQLMLNDIKARIDSELNDFYSSELTELEKKLKQYSVSKKDNNIKQLLRNCGVARSKVVTALTQFKDAFSINIGDYNNFSLESLTHICQQICINSNNDCNNIKWTINADSNTLFEGKYFVSFVDSLSILLNNAINHSGFTSFQDIEINVEAVEAHGEEKDEAIKTFNGRGIGIANVSSRVFSVSVKNNLHNSINVDSLEQKLNNIFLSIREDRGNKIQSEGGSGLHKLCNIVQNNIEAPYYIGYTLPEQNICVSYVFIANNIIKGDNDANINS